MGPAGHCSVIQVRTEPTREKLEPTGSWVGRSRSGNAPRSARCSQRGAQSRFVRFRHEGVVTLAGGRCYASSARVYKLCSSRSLRRSSSAPRRSACSALFCAPFACQSPPSSAGATRFRRDALVLNCGYRWAMRRRPARAYPNQVRILLPLVVAVVVRLPASAHLCSTEPQGSDEQPASDQAWKQGDPNHHARLLSQAAYRTVSSRI